MYYNFETSRIKLKNTSVSKFVHPFHCSNKLFYSDLKIFENSRPSVSNYKSFFWITRTVFFSHRRKEQFLEQSTIASTQIASLFTLIEAGKSTFSMCVLPFFIAKRSSHFRTCEEISQFLRLCKL